MEKSVERTGEGLTQGPWNLPLDPLPIDHFPMEEKELRPYSALAFAYIGDSVIDLIVKTCLVAKAYNRPDAYHARAVKYVNASAQTRMMKAIRPLLSEEEYNMFRRGRNSKMISPAKNQSPHDYRIATGLEALIGYLYLAGKIDRVMELIGAGMDYLEPEIVKKGKEEE